MSALHLAPPPYGRSSACRPSLILDSVLLNVHNERGGLISLSGDSIWLFAGDLMQRLLEAGADELVIWIAVLAALLAVAIYVIRKVRGAPVQHEPKASELMSKFRESHTRGELSDEEFRTIKTTLGRQLREELKDDGETGWAE